MLSALSMPNREIAFAYYNLLLTCLIAPDAALLAGEERREETKSRPYQKVTIF